MVVFKGYVKLTVIACVQLTGIRKQIPEQLSRSHRPQVYEWLLECQFLYCKSMIIEYCVHSFIMYIVL